VASIEESTSLNSNINLDRVLYVSNFSCNLVSIAQLIRELRYIVIFDEDLYIIQDRITTSQIGVGRMWGGVYYVDKLASPTVQVNVVGSYDLWHGCLGHPSNQVLSLLP